MGSFFLTCTVFMQESHEVDSPTSYTSWFLEDGSPLKLMLILLLHHAAKLANKLKAPPSTSLSLLYSFTLPANFKSQGIFLTCTCVVTHYASVFTCILGSPSNQST